jgi:prepilin-type N-terminal cleavage/methylation domain-containing protein/prepilin-type processing-associated H-X9-DG protein
MLQHTLTDRTDRQNGTTLIEVIVVLAIIAVLAGLIASGVSMARQRADRATCLSNLRQVAIATSAYADLHGKFPNGVSVEVNDEPSPYSFMSWLTYILPQAGRDDLWQNALNAYQADPNFLHDPPHSNLSIVMTVYTCPSDHRAQKTGQYLGSGPSYAFTSYLGNLGLNERKRDGVFFRDSIIRRDQVSDGLSQTLLAGERPPSANLLFGWWYAGMGQHVNGDAEMILGVRARAYSIYAEGCPEGPYHFQAGRFSDMCDTFHFWSPHAGGAHFAFCDGSVRFLSYSVDALLPALASRAGNESVEIP